MAHPDLADALERWHRDADLNDETQGWPRLFNYFKYTHTFDVDKKGPAKPHQYAKVLSLSSMIKGIHEKHIGDSTRLLRPPDNGSREAQIWKLFPRVEAGEYAYVFRKLQSAIQDAQEACNQAIQCGVFSEDEKQWCGEYVKLLADYEAKLWLTENNADGEREHDEYRLASMAGWTELQACWLLKWACRGETTDLNVKVEVLGRSMNLRQVSVTICDRDLIFYTLQDPAILRPGLSKTDPVPLEMLIGAVETGAVTLFGTHAKVFLGCEFMTQKPFDYKKQTPLASVDCCNSWDEHEAREALKRRAFSDRRFLTWAESSSATAETPPKLVRCTTHPEPEAEKESTAEQYMYIMHMFDLVSLWQLAENGVPLFPPQEKAKEVKNSPKTGDTFASQAHEKQKLIGNEHHTKSNSVRFLPR